MEKNKLSTLTLEELYEKRKKLKSTSMGIGIGMVVICSVLLYLIFKTKNFVLLAVVPGCLMTLLPSFIVLSQLNTEIKSRESK
ncbi:hypothetical protein [Pedobacter sp. Hv1]|uniref:hypothetical protein n=1 Tax=Pedobacter sp. Hv1 TaxID=1740090 RepID=UPI0006D8A4BD|nr:hypothetical protein [Pedobacter sp. Hv1]KQC00711.1 hypothetical protein AQF98_08510 [Pedobacter sp. Hv1]